MSTQKINPKGMSFLAFAQAMDVAVRGNPQFAGITARWTRSIPVVPMAPPPPPKPPTYIEGGQLGGAEVFGVIPPTPEYVPQEPKLPGVDSDARFRLRLNTSYLSFRLQQGSFGEHTLVHFNWADHASVDVNLQSRVHEGLTAVFELDMLPPDGYGVSASSQSSYGDAAPEELDEEDQDPSD